MNYIVYIHKFPNNKVYIGITRENPERRWRKGKGYRHNTYLTDAVKKYGWENIKHEILYENLTKEQAEEKEIELIAQYDSTNREKGYNFDKGGSLAGKHSQETILKMIKKGKDNGNSKSILQYDLEGNFIRKYESMREAEQITGIKHQNISMCCRKNKYSQSGGYVWVYEKTNEEVV